jgi:hypothetical protein
VDSHSEGPFVLQLTDLHSSNIFVDDDWNIVAIIDLEFMCALPPRMINVPYWLSVDNIDDIAENMDAYNKMHKTFLDVLQSEEQTASLDKHVQIASTIQESWTSYSSWFYLSLTSIDGMAYCVEAHLYEKFGLSISKEEEDQWMRLMSSFWPTDSKQFVERNSVRRLSTMKMWLGISRQNLPRQPRLILSLCPQHRRPITLPGE